ncbi:MAG TPA: helix-turn-helix domain-containing protein, partial [Erysipelotrichaceae bacterium]|nr:helix-turn-helix domain-containing protein [Erysipelotrichaceae bacterium]
TSVFVGIHTNYSNLYNIYKEESKLFSSNKRSGQVLTFNDVFIPSYVKSSLSKSPIASQLRNVLNNDKDLSDMIKSLWKHQGNMSAAAQDLYIHRNTVNYRLDRLNSEYNLNLRNMQELLLCYLLVI